jgi:hypothetical protein
MFTLIKTMNNINISDSAQVLLVGGALYLGYTILDTFKKPLDTLSGVADDAIKTYVKSVETVVGLFDEKPKSNVVDYTKVTVITHNTGDIKSLGRDPFTGKWIISGTRDASLDMEDAAYINAYLQQTPSGVKPRAYYQNVTNGKLSNIVRFEYDDRKYYYDIDSNAWVSSSGLPTSTGRPDRDIAPIYQ